MRALIFLGILLIFIGFFLVTLGMILPDKEKKEENVEYAGIIMIGPIPIVFGNSKNLIIFSILITILMIIWILMFLLSFRVVK
ncbi:hypothetical protein J422_00235 [Methanocaldococcus villosus KIN24-T80]|uniref:TIGR00304 family protein n=1 Tax=Methanocaldococcus villosus KIN24-T80 TaxID=1069083 RepID=N6V3J2_9EURY|nr:TIGR00304 family protein [Methanocaldococcus villosus]ENN96828.1 hypothetical protein J422_00235 [Methanocaldococcus villosus KIN24-T80]